MLNTAYRVCLGLFEASLVKLFWAGYTFPCVLLWLLAIGQAICTLKSKKTFHHTKVLKHVPARQNAFRLAGLGT